MKLSALATSIGGTQEGGGDPDITGVAPLDRAGAADLAFLAHPRYLADVAGSRAGALLVKDALAGDLPAGGVPRIRVPDVYAALATLLTILYPPEPHRPGIHPTAVLGSGVSLGEEVRIGPYVVVGDGCTLGARARLDAHVVLGEGCRLAEDVHLHPHVTLYAGVEVGARTILHSGVRAGVDGFGYAFTEGEHRKIPHVGRCVIGPDVEIGANTTIDRGSVGWTEIGAGVKIDNLVQVGHNARIGDLSIVAALAGISGSTILGRRVTMGGQSATAGHLSIGDGATVAARGAVFGDLPGGGVYSGYPARPHREALRTQAAAAKLPDLIKRMRALEQALAARGDDESE